MKILDIPQSGSLAGQTSSRNRYGQYRRTRAIPVNPNTAAQQAIRSDFAVSSATWRSLLDAEREAWATYAQDHPVQDGLGQPVILTGAQMYVSVNTRMLAITGSQVTAPPADPTPNPIATLIVTATAPGTLSLAFTVTPVPAGINYLWYASAPISAGRSYPGGFKLIGTSAAAAASPAAIGAAYIARWGNFQVGQRIYVRGIAMRITDGAISQPITADDIAA